MLTLENYARNNDNLLLNGEENKLVKISHYWGDLFSTIGGDSVMCQDRGDKSQRFRF